METIYRAWSDELPRYEGVAGMHQVPTCAERVEIVVETSEDTFGVSTDRMALEEFIETLRMSAFELKEGEKAAITFSCSSGYDGEPGDIEYSCSVVRYENDEEYAARQAFLKSYYAEREEALRKAQASAEQKERAAYEALKKKFEGGS